MRDDALVSATSCVLPCADFASFATGPLKSCVAVRSWMDAIVALHHRQGFAMGIFEMYCGEG